MAGGTGAAREQMTAYWQEHSVEATVEEMMLDDEAQKIHELERDEILALLPPIEGSRVLELAAGLGRFTGRLADAGAAAVVAVEFMSKFCDANVADNAARPAVSVVCQDVTTLERPACSHDLIFSNWLLMYLSDAEVSQLASDALRWLAPGGSLFFRESCFRQSGNAKRTFNPTHYRTPEAYSALFSSTTYGGFGFELVRSQPVQTYIEHKDNSGQICWLYTKTDRAVKLLAAPAPPTVAESIVDCSNVFVVNMQYGAGAYATRDIAAGEMVEKGIVRRLTNCDGNENPYVFTWSDDTPNTTWALGSGCSTFYNTASAEEANTHMERFFDEDRFEIRATKDIKKGDELLHVYKSKQWRTCFSDLADPHT